MALVPITVFQQFTSAEVTFLSSLADHVYTSGQLVIGNGTTGGVSISTLTAGTNITITNGNGSITIASVAGGGFTVLPATGAVNSVNAVFSFTLQPSYIVSDGAWYRVNKGWTWSSPNATMTIPPNNDIYGIQ